MNTSSLASTSHLNSIGPTEPVPNGAIGGAQSDDRRRRFLEWLNKRAKTLADDLASRGFVRRVLGCPNHFNRHDVNRTAFRTRKSGRREASGHEWLAGKLVPSSTGPARAPAASTPVSRARIDGWELSDMLRQASPFSPFKPQDKVLAPLLRDAVALRTMEEGRLRDLAAARLRASLTQALFQTEGPRVVDGPRRAERQPRLGDERRREVLLLLISDTDDRYKPSIAAFQPPQTTRRPWSWFP
ncbi:hypothetical protein PV762_26655 [Mitsuaria sp. CC2]|uniref:hypothetical protein n=1 Tax=Mitsuaria sp. CC2 TaxID=3029186 RepID=UPI003B8D8FEC